LNNIMRLGGVLLCAASLSACATITRGTSQNFVITTDPVGAQVALSTGQTCTSPCRLHLKRKTAFTVTTTMDGYQEGHAAVRSRMHGGGGAALAGNAIFGGIVGGVVDATNGSLRDLRPNPLHITMARIGEAVAPTVDDGGPDEAPPAAAAQPQD
jgi:hypothetical protein